FMNKTGYARGGRAGGPSLSFAKNAPLVVKPEEIDSYEVGLKSSFFDDRLIANFAAFWANDHNYITRAKDNSNAVLVDVMSNAKLATSKGFELDLRAKPFEGFDTFASFVYDDARYADFKNGVCPPELSFPSCDMTGKRLALVPKFAFSAGAEYAWKVGTIAPISSSVPLVAYVGTDVSYQSSTYSTPDNSAYAVVSPYALLNFHLGVKLEDDSYDLQGWVKNALNHRYWQALWASWDLGSGEIGGQPGEPLFAGITLRAKFPSAAGAPAFLASALPSSDLPSKKGPPGSRYDWRGVYVGFDVGHAWGHDRFVPYYSVPNVGAPQSFDLTGVIGGLHAGYNWQLASVVLGVETEFDATSLNRTVQQDAVTTLRSSSALQGSIRARFGWAFDRLLVFGTGGSQWAGVQNAYHIRGLGDSYSTNHHSWVVGGGIEYALTDHWLGRAEYRFSDFGKNLDGNGPIIWPLSFQSHHWKEDRLTAGLSWKFADN
ncbi:outer membrane beta-barrel protein, partial [Methylosinus sp. 3S-1]